MATGGYGEGPRSARHTPGEQRRRGVIAVLVMNAVMWVAEVLDQLTHHLLDRDLGLHAWHLSGLDGVLFSPFLHAGFGHLLNNTVPFLVLGVLIALTSSLGRVLAVTAIVMVVGGLGTWLTTPPSTLVVGASGVVFGYAGYLIARGVFDRRIGQLLIGAVVLVLFGGSLLLSLVPQAGISWQGHLFGGIGGVVAAWLLRRPRPSSVPSPPAY